MPSWHLVKRGWIVQEGAVRLFLFRPYPNLTKILALGLRKLLYYAQ